MTLLRRILLLLHSSSVGCGFAVLRRFSGFLIVIIAQLALSCGSIRLDIVVFLNVGFGFILCRQFDIHYIHIFAQYRISGNIAVTVILPGILVLLHLNILQILAVQSWEMSVGAETPVIQKHMLTSNDTHRDGVSGGWAFE